MRNLILVASNPNDRALEEINGSRKGAQRKGDTVMELRKAKMCTDCDEIYEGEACPRCGSAVYWWMSKKVHVVKEGRKNVAPRSKYRGLSHGRKRMAISIEITACSEAEAVQG